MGRCVQDVQHRGVDMDFYTLTIIGCCSLCGLLLLSGYFISVQRKSTERYAAVSSLSQESEGSLKQTPLFAADDEAFNDYIDEDHSILAIRETYNEEPKVAEVIPFPSIDEETEEETEESDEYESTVASPHDGFELEEEVRVAEPIDDVSDVYTTASSELEDEEEEVEEPTPYGEEPVMAEESHPLPHEPLHSTTNNMSNAMDMDFSHDSRFVFYVRASHGFHFEGRQLRAFLEEHGLTYEDSGAFTYKTVDHQPCYHVVNALQPGRFDLEDMDNLRTLAIMLLMPLNGTVEPIAAFNELVRLFAEAAEKLNGVVLDENRNPLSMQTLEHYRELAAERSRQLMVHQM